MSDTRCITAADLEKDSPVRLKIEAVMEDWIPSYLTEAGRLRDVDDLIDWVEKYLVDDGIEFPLSTETAEYRKLKKIAREVADEIA